MKINEPGEFIVRILLLIIFLSAISCTYIFLSFFASQKKSVSVVRKNYTVNKGEINLVAGNIWRIEVLKSNGQVVLSSTIRTTDLAISPTSAREEAPFSVFYLVKTGVKKHVVKKGDTLFELGYRNGTYPSLIAYFNNIKDEKCLSIGQKLDIPILVDFEARGKASWYSLAESTPIMANGRDFKEDVVYNIASKTLPLGFRGWMSISGKWHRFIVTDRGPYVDGRIADLTPAAAEYFNFKHLGVADIILRFNETNVRLDS